MAVYVGVHPDVCVGVRACKIVWKVAGRGGSENALLIERHFKLHLSESAEVLGSADASVTIGIIVQQTVQCRRKLVRIQIAVACSARSKSIYGRCTKQNIVAVP